MEPDVKRQRLRGTVTRFLDTVPEDRQSGTVTPLLPMPYIEIPGFVSRATAERDYKRSKSSFIRDVDDAFTRDDVEFLSHFSVLLNDGDSIEGPKATKDAVQAVQAKQPRWYIETAFLDTRYWDQSEPSTKEGIHSSKSVKRTIKQTVSEVIELQHKLELAEQRNSTKDETIVRLEEHNTFLQEEMEFRRGELDKLRGFFESVGEAADSTAKLRRGTPDESVNVVSADVAADASVPGTGIFARHLPTFSSLFTYLRSH